MLGPTSQPAVVYVMTQLGVTVPLMSTTFLYQNTRPWLSLSTVRDRQIQLLALFESSKAVHPLAPPTTLVVPLLEARSTHPACTRSLVRRHII